jgi:hypothetical protein
MNPSTWIAPGGPSRETIPGRRHGRYRDGQDRPGGVCSTPDLAWRPLPPSLK